MSEVRRIPREELQARKKTEDSSSDRELSNEKQEPVLDQPEITGPSPKTDILREYRPQQVSSSSTGAFFRSREGMNNVQASPSRWHKKKKKH